MVNEKSCKRHKTEREDKRGFHNLCSITKRFCYSPIDNILVQWAEIVPILSHLVYNKNLLVCNTHFCSYVV